MLGFLFHFCPLFLYKHEHVHKVSLFYDKAKEFFVFFLYQFRKQLSRSHYSIWVIVLFATSSP